MTIPVLAFLLALALLAALDLSADYTIAAYEELRRQIPATPAPRPRRRPKSPKTPDGQREQASPRAEPATRPDRPAPNPRTLYGP